MDQDRALLFKQILLSPPLRFAVGPEKTIFTVHADLATHFSENFDRAFKGDWRESAEGSYPLENVDEDTFVRFGQFLYTGDYATAVVDEHTRADHMADDNPIVARTPDDVPVVEEGDIRAGGINEPPIFTSPLDETTEPFWGLKDRKKGKKAARVIPTKEQKLWDAFRRRAPQLPEGKSRLETTVCDRYTEMYSCHLRLYVFAEKYGISPLAQLCLSYLHHALLTTEMVPERIPDIVELAQYSYKNTSRRADGLRSLVAHYVACHTKSLIKSEGFQSLLVDCGELGRDVMVRESETE